MKHVIQISLPANEHCDESSEALHCEHCGDYLHIYEDPPLWIQLALKDAFLLTHRDCPNDPQPRHLCEHIRYARSDRRPRAPLPHLQPTQDRTESIPVRCLRGPGVSADSRPQEGEE